MNYILIREILEELEESYPDPVCIWDLSCLKEYDERTQNKILFYLCDHNMIDGHESKELSSTRSLFNACITVKGIDFLEPSGGLSTLNAPIIRIAPEHIKQLIGESLQGSELPPKEQNRIMQGIEKMSEQAIMTMISELTKKSISYLPEILKFMG